MGRSVQLRALLGERRHDLAEDRNPRRACRLVGLERVQLVLARVRPHAVRRHLEVFLQDKQRTAGRMRVSIGVA